LFLKKKYAERLLWSYEDGSSKWTQWNRKAFTCDKRTNLSENIEKLLKIAILGENEELMLFFILIKST